MAAYDELERRSAEARERDLAVALPKHLAAAIAGAPGLAAHLNGVDPAQVTGRAALAGLPVLRKSDLGARQTAADPLGGFATKPAAEFHHLFMSPGPIFEPGGTSADWWRFGRFLHALGIGAGDVVQNCFAYHLTPAGHMFENGCAAVGAAVIAAGTGNTEGQVAAAAALGATAFAGTPDYLKVILEAADAAGTTLGFRAAAVSGGALFPQLRSYYEDRGITCRQCYATADLGHVAYESEAMEGMIIDEGVIVEIVRPGTGDPVPDGEVGEVVVTTFNRDYPLIRFATGDLSAVLPGESPCGRTNMRIKGWMGRADQTTKVKGMFVRPEQIAEIARRHPGARLRLEVLRDGDQDTMRLRAEGAGLEPAALEADMQAVLKLRGAVVVEAAGSLPNDGKVIDDLRSYD